MKRYCYAFFFSACLFSFHSLKVDASHSMGSDITYRCLGGLTYEITLSFYRDCAGVPADAQAYMDITSTCYGNYYAIIDQVPGTGTEISPVCPGDVSTCNGGTFTGIQEYIYRGVITLPGPCADWTFSYNLCCRNAAITNISNPAGTMMYVFAVLNNTITPCNNSPVFSNRPVPFACLGQQFCFNHGAYDPDGDSLAFAMYTPFDSPGLPVSYVAPFNPVQVLSSSPPISFDPQTGDICMTPTNLEVTVMAVLVSEYRNGVLIGQVERDIQVTVINCNNQLPSVTGIDGTSNFSQTVCADAPTCFTLFSTDPDAAQNTTINWDYSIPGATFTIQPGQRESAVFCWTPSQSDISPNPHCFTVSVNDDNCPYIGTQIFSYCITVTGATANAGPDRSACLGQTATLNASGGGTYSWSPGGGTGAALTVTPTSTTSYTVTVTDANGCTATDVALVTITPPPNTPISTQDVMCNGGSDGSATVSPSGGNSPYTYSWLPGGGNAATATGLSTGNYTVTVTDATGCSATASATINEPPPMNISSSVTPASCGGGNDGTATVTAGGGQPAYSYSWAPFGGNGATATGLSAGTYTVTVTDANGCTGTGLATVTGPGAIALIATADSASCFGTSTGSATVNASGGTAGYSYTWSPAGGTGAVASNLAAGNYTVTVTDANGCSASSTVAVPEPLLLQAGISATDVLCNGGTSGIASVTVNGGTPAYNFVWSPVSGNDSILSGLPAGTYTVDITDLNGCTTNASITILEPAGLSISVTTDSARCQGDASGTATAMVTGGTNGYSYLWSPGGNTNSVAANLMAGTYSVTVTDANGCSISGNTTIYEPPAMILSTTSDSASCYNTATGSATASAAGGVPGYTWSWLPGGFQSATPTGLSAGTYTVTVTDSYGCTGTSSVTIDQPDDIILNTATTPALCYGDQNGTASVSAGGGIPGYTYLWSPSGGILSAAGNLSAGNYTVTVTDQQGCSRQGNVTVTQPAAIQLQTSSTATLCFGSSDGVATVSVSGGTPSFSYLWSPTGNTSASATGLATGNYSVLVTDANGCTTSAGTMVNQPPALSLSGSTTAATCGLTDGTATVVAGGGTPGYSYQWQPSGGNNPVAGGLGTGQYHVLVTDANGCQDTLYLSVPSTNGPSSTAAVTGNVSCYGGSDGSASVAINSGAGPFTVNWSPSGGSALTASGLAAGTYSVTVADVNGCTDVNTVTITQPSVLTTVMSANPVSCFGFSNGSASVTAGGGIAPYTYSWNPVPGSSFSLQNLASGTYSVTITDSHGCTRLSSVTVGSPPAIQMQLQSVPASCFGLNDGTAAALVSGGVPGYSYQWSPSGGNQTVASGLFSGWYQLTVTDTLGCHRADSVYVDQPDELQPIMTATGVSCYGLSDGQAGVTVSGGTPGYSYNWSPGGAVTAQINSLAYGTYTVTITDHQGCSTSSSVTVNNAAPINLTVSGPDTVCTGQPASLLVGISGGTAPFQYFWNNGLSDSLITVNPVNTTVYSVYVMDANHCTTSPDSLTVAIFPPLQIITTGSTQLCAGTPTQIAASASGGNGGPYYFTWNDSAITGSSASVTPWSDTTFIATVSDGCSPPVSGAVQILVLPSPIVDFLPHEISGCTPVEVNFANYTVTPAGSSWAWNLDDNTLSNDSSPSHTYTRPGTYDISLTVASPEGCTSSLLVQDAVTVYGYPDADFLVSDNNVTVFNPTITFTDYSSGAHSWFWDLGDGTTDTGVTAITHQYQDSGYYTIRLIVSGEGGCMDTTYATVHVEEVFTLYIPNTFTPNGDGINDGFIAYGHGISRYDMWIMDRWGRKIFHSESMDQPWDGSYYGNNTICQNDVYEYIIEVHDFNQKKHRYIGHVNLVK